MVKHEIQPKITNNGPIPLRKKLGTLSVLGLQHCVVFIVRDFKAIIIPPSTFWRNVPRRRPFYA